jgi:hypothetical protein
MIRKFIYSALLGALLVGSGVNVAKANSSAQVVAIGSFTNLLAFTPNIGSVSVKQISISSLSTTNASALLFDVPTNSTVVTNAAYSNTGTYATNLVTIWTNFYNVVQSNTTLAVVDYSNNVPAGTNSVQPKLAIATAAGTTTTYTFSPASNIGTSGGYYFDQGIWVTNTSLSPLAITITY